MTNVRKEDTFLCGKNNFVLPVLCLGHRDDITTLLLQVLAEQDLTVANPDQIDITAQLTTEQRVLIDLQHAENMFA